MTLNAYIADESDRLKTVALWGEPGCETLLDELYPRELSLFSGAIDILKARAEVRNFIQVLKKHHVKVFQVRDVLAQHAAKTPSLTCSQLREKLFNRIERLHLLYHKRVSHIKDLVDILLHEDIKRYGEEKAVALNALLSLQFAFPLGNVIYARDHAQVLFGTCIQANFKKPIRKQESTIYEKMYTALKLPKMHKLPPNQTWEGGDVYLHDNTVYIGVGSRTSMSAARCIYRIMQPELKKNSAHCVAVVDSRAKKRSFLQQMDFMHLDTFSMPFGQKQMLLYVNEAVHRRVFFFEHTGSKEQITDSGMNFYEHLLRQGNDIIPVRREEQHMFATNIVPIDATTILMPLNCPRIIRELQKRGKKVIVLGLNEIVKGYGAAHCMTFQILRSSAP